MTAVASAEPTHRGPRLRPWHVRMTGRDPAQAYRASTPLVLLFDLCFVVAVARLTPARSGGGPDRLAAPWISVPAAVLVVALLDCGLVALNVATIARDAA